MSTSAKIICALVLAAALAPAAPVFSQTPQEGEKPRQTAPVVAPTAPPVAPVEAERPDGAEGEDDEEEEDEKEAGAAADAPAPAEQGPRRRRNADGDPDRPSNELTIEATEQNKIGDVVIYTGYVDARYQNVRLQADRVEYNTTNDDAIAEGNVIFDQGASQRVTARRAEINIATKLGTFYDATGFTDRTPTGEFLYYTASRIDKVGPDEYVLYDADVTACEDSVPKWSFTADEARLRVNDRVRLRNALFDIKGKPVFYVPYASIPINRRERQSGFLLPRFGNSNAKGFTYTQAYYQTLGRSADATIRGDYFSARGLGLGLEFRARTDERSGINFGSFLVFDRLWGEEGPDQGGSAFFVDGVQYLPQGWIAVADVRVTSNLAFRRTFSDSFEEIINPAERSTLYFNNNTGRYSVNLLFESDSTAIQERDIDRPQLTADYNINIRHLPSIELLTYDRPLWKDWPVYFSFDVAADGLRRRERIGDTTVFATPNVVQRLDLMPRFTFPVPLDLDGWAITPSLTLRSTFYSNSLNPQARRFDPRFFTLDPNDPRLIPVTPSSDTGGVDVITFFDPNNPSLVVGENLTRNYAELAVDVRPPAFARVFTNDEGQPAYKHVVEPYLVYRKIGGIGDDISRVILFDERDAVADTNELEYGIVNRWFVRRRERGIAGGGGGGRKRRAERAREGENDDDEDEDEDERESGGEGQPHELLSLTVRQKYFFDPTFGGALSRTRRNQFYPITTFSGFSYGGIERRFSPVNVVLRARPLSTLFADLRFDYDVQRNGIKDVALTAGARGQTWSVNQTYYFNRRFRAFRGRVEPGTYSGNQWITAFDLGDVKRGLYGGTRLNIDFTDRVDESNPEEELSEGRLLNTRSYLGYAWDCCSVQLNYDTFNLPSGLRRESRVYFTFSLAGLGSIGNESIGQPAQTRRINRGRGRRNLLALPEDRP